MDIFGDTWHNHVERIEQAWNRSVNSGDTVLIVGDTDWALHLRDAMETLERLDSWTGHKILVRGNHDYWWTSKTTNKVRKSLPPSLRVLHNEALQVDGWNICGAKGCPVPGGIDWTAENAKLLNREQQRLCLSLADRDPALPTILAMHYPPFYPSTGTSSFKDIVDSEAVAHVVYGHLHGRSGGSGPTGTYGNTRYWLVSADSLDFSPALIVTNVSGTQEEDHVR